MRVTGGNGATPVRRGGVAYRIPVTPGRDKAPRSGRGAEPPNPRPLAGGRHSRPARSQSPGAPAGFRRATGTGSASRVCAQRTGRTGRRERTAARALARGEEAPWKSWLLGKSPARVLPVARSGGATSKSSTPSRSPLVRIRSFTTWWLAAPGLGAGRRWTAGGKARRSQRPRSEAHRPHMGRVGRTRKPCVSGGHASPGERAEGAGSGARAHG